MIFALARPQTTTKWEESTTEGIDIILAIDISSSMNEKDLKPNRLESAKEVAKEFDIDIFEMKGRTILPLLHSFMLSADQRSLYYLFLKFTLKDKVINQGFFYLIKWLRRSK